VCDSELQAKHELKMQALRDELELRRKTEIHEIEEVYVRSSIVNLIPDTPPLSYLPFSLSLSLYLLHFLPFYTMIYAYMHTHTKEQTLILYHIMLFMQRKNGQISALMKNHEKAFSDIKNYYNDITLNNLALINSLKVCDIVVCQSLSLTLLDLAGHYLI
jgi:hypothetical protein